MRLSQILTAVLVCVLVCLPTIAGADEQAPRLPNVVFIFADDLGYGDLACYGHPYARTPHIDSLAEDGTRFEQFYVSGITCCPSRTGIMTSVNAPRYVAYPARHGFGDRVTVTELLNDHGYTTGHFGKWHIGPTNDPGTYGIDVIRSGNNRQGDREQGFGRNHGAFSVAIDFIRDNSDGLFYVNIWAHSTHYPVNPPAHYAERFADLEVDESLFGSEMQAKFELVRRMGRDVDQGMRNYLGDVSALDDEVGRVLAVLEELGISENTIVVFSSDHGPAPVRPRNGDGEVMEFAGNMLGSPGPFRGGKHDHLEGGVRSPFIIRWPGHVPAGRVDTDSVISALDWLPTLCDIAGVEVRTRGMDGEVVTDAWLGRSAHVRDRPLMWRTSSARAPIAIRSGNWKLYTWSRGENAGRVELYDLSTDPAEANNLADEHPDVVEELVEEVDAWRDELPRRYTGTNNSRG